MRSFCFAFSIILLAAGNVAAGENWPVFRGPSGNGVSDSTGLPVVWSEKENVKWKTPIHDKGWSSPSVWGDQIWLTTATEEGKKLYGVCVNAQSGKIIHDLLLFEVENPTDTRRYNSYASPSPVIDEGRVYLHFGSNGTACLDAKTAKLLWKRTDLACDHFRGPGSSPIIFEKLLYAHYDGFDYQYIAALDKKTGKTVWKKDRNIEYGTDNGDFKKAYSTPIIIDIGGKKQLISPAAKAAISYDPFTGEELWKVRYEQHSVAARPLFHNGTVYINTGFGKGQLYAVRADGNGDVTNSHVDWIAVKSVPSMTSQLLVDGLIYMIQDGGVATCLDAKTGESVWTKRIGGKFAASLIYAEGRIYMFDRAGKTTVIKAGRKFEKLATNSLDDGCMASSAVTGKALIVRTNTHLYRIEK